MALPQPQAFGATPSLNQHNHKLQPNDYISPTQPEPMRWHGEAPPEVDALVERLGELTEQNPEVFAGVALSYDRQSVSIYSATEDYAIRAPEVAGLISRNSTIVNVVPVARSKNDLSEIDERVTAKVGENNVLTSAIDVTQNRVVLGISSEYSSRMNLASLDKSEEHGVIFDIVESAEDTVGRYDDYPRYYMGGAIVYDRKVCSSGIPVSVNGARGLLTAGHCRGGRFTTLRSRFVGNEYTTAYPGNAYKYGDWKILYGSTYAPNIFSGAANSSSAANYTISGIVKRQPGQEVCSSGQTTGEICRFVVETTDSYLRVKGVRSDRLTHTYHDGNRDGYSDCGGWQGGDSGGPVYAGAGLAGHVNATGIVKGQYRNILGKCRYSYTQFDGVKAWNSGVKLDR